MQNRSSASLSGLTGDVVKCPESFGKAAGPGGGTAQVGRFLGVEEAVRGVCGRLPENHYVVHAGLEVGSVGGLVLAVGGEQTDVSPFGP